MRKILITGMGLNSSLGKNLKQNFIKIEKLKSGLKLKSKTKNFNFKNIGKKFIAEENLKNFYLEKINEISFLALNEAIKDAKLNKRIKYFEPKKIGIFFGTCNGKILTLENFYDNFYKNIKFNDIIKHHCDNIDIIFNLLNKKILGQKHIFVNACTSSNNAICFASDLIKSNEIDIAILLGAETLSLTTISGFNSFNSFANNNPSAFSKNNIGLTLGEGAGALILEANNNPNLPKKIYAKILGYSSFGEITKNNTSSSSKGLENSIKEAIKISKLKKENINIICSHGTGTQNNNISESKAIKNVFKKNLLNLKITSLKPFFGHTLGASGIIQNIIMIKSMEKNFIPPILNYQGNNSLLPESVFIKNPIKNIKYNYFLSNSSAFGGNNTAIIFSKFNKTKKSINNKKIKNEEIVITNLEIFTPIAKSKNEFFSILKNKQILNQKNNLIKFKDFNQIFKNTKKLQKFSKNPNYIKFSIKNIFDLLKNYKINHNKETGIIFGNYKSILNFIENFYLEIKQIGIEFASALKFQNSTFNSTSGHIANIFKINGYNSTFFGQFSSLTAIQYAINLLSNHKQKEIIIGSTNEISQYDEKFIKSQNLILSEGASSLILTTKKLALKNNKKILATIKGFSTNNISILENNENLKKISLNECINDTLQKTNLFLKNIDLHISENFNEINSTKFLGLIETSTPIIDILLGIYYLKSYQKKYKNILFSFQNVHGINFSFILN